MSKQIPGPYGADVRDHVISYRAKCDIGEEARETERKIEREGWAEKTEEVWAKTSLLQRGKKNDLSILRYYCCTVLQMCPWHRFCTNTRTLSTPLQDKMLMVTWDCMAHSLVHHELMHSIVNGVWKCLCVQAGASPVSSPQELWGTEHWWQQWCRSECPGQSCHWKTAQLWIFITEKGNSLSSAHVIWNEFITMLMIPVGLK